jgi:hypothetical protein
VASLAVALVCGLLAACNSDTSNGAQMTSDAGDAADASPDVASSAPDSATGSVAIDASVTVVPPPPPTACPGIDSFSVIPAALTVGGKSAVSVTTVPNDVTPTVGWSASDATGQTGAGTFADPSAASTTFQCTQVGQVTVAVSVATGPCAGAPFTTMSALVTCDPSK